MIRPWQAHLADLEAHRPFRDFEYVYAAEDGRTLHFRISGRPVYDDDGRFVGYRGTGSDVTAVNHWPKLRASSDF